MQRVGTSPGLELNGIDHNLQRAGSNLNAATAAIAEPFLKRPMQWHQPTFFWRPEARKVSEQLQSFQIDQISESLHQELHTFLEAALSDAANDIRKSSESVISEMQKRFDAFLEQEEDRATKLQKAGVQAERLVQELPVNLSERLQQVESQLLNLKPPDNSPAKKELPMESSMEQMRLAIQVQGVSKSLKSLEERFSVTQSRLTRNEKTSQQALAQARHLETMIAGLQTNVEDQSSFQNLRRQVREMSKILASASLSGAGESFEELQKKVLALEHQMCNLESAFDKIGHHLNRKDSTDSKDEAVRTFQSFRQDLAGSPPPMEVAIEGLHFADGTVESSKRNLHKESFLRSPERSQERQAGSPKALKRHGIEWPA
eukprot:symbB.v1.2.028892.t1/scaffold3107.1/size63424/4